MRLSIIIPTFNEKGNIIKMIGKIQRLIQTHDYEIIIVDDDSSDKTGETVQKKYSRSTRIRCIIRKQDRSLGKSILLGLEKSRGKIIVGMDADGNHNPKILPELLNNLSNYDMIVCSRYVKGGGMQNRYRYWTSLSLNFFLKILLKSKIHDLTSGYYIIKRGALMKLPLKKIYYGYGDYFIRLIYYAQEKKLLISEKPDYFPERWSGKSKSRLGQMILSYILTGFKLRLT